MKYFIIFCFLLSLPCFSAEVFNSITVKKAKTPYLLTLIIDHLKIVPLAPSKAKVILRKLKSLSDNLEQMDPINQKFFISSEIYKAALNFEFKKKSSQDTINGVDIEKLEKRLIQYKVIYSPFAQFIIQSTYQDFAPFLKDNFIDRYQSMTTSSGLKYVKAQKLKKLLKYSGKWVIAINDLAPEKLNGICTQLIMNYLENAKLQSKIFKLHALKQEKKNPPLEGFELAKVQSFLNKEASDQLNESPPKSSPKREATKAIENINVDPVDKATQDIDKLFEQQSL